MRLILFFMCTLSAGTHAEPQKRIKPKACSPALKRNPIALAARIDILTVGIQRQMLTQLAEKWNLPREQLSTYRRHSIQDLRFVARQSVPREDMEWPTDNSALLKKTIELLPMIKSRHADQTQAEFWDFLIWNRIFRVGGLTKIEAAAQLGVSTAKIAKEQDRIVIHVRRYLHRNLIGQLKI